MLPINLYIESSTSLFPQIVTDFNIHKSNYMKVEHIGIAVKNLENSIPL